MEKISYALGLGIGQQLKSMNIENFDIKEFSRSIEDVMAGRDTDMTAREAQVMLSEYFQKKEKEQAEENIAKGKAYLEEGSTFTLTTREIEGDSTRVSITYTDLPSQLKQGDRVLIDDGRLELTVKELTDTDVVCNVITGGDLTAQLYADGVAVEGKKRKEEVEVKENYPFEQIKWTKEYLDFK